MYNHPPLFFNMSEEILGFNRQVNVNYLTDQIKIFPFLTNGGSSDVMERILHKGFEFYSYLCYFTNREFVQTNISEPQSPHLLNGENVSHEGDGEWRINETKYVKMPSRKISPW